MAPKSTYNPQVQRRFIDWEGLKYLMFNTAPNSPMTGEDRYVLCPHSEDTYLPSDSKSKKVGPCFLTSS